ncbi:MAG: patatin-like phospholipase family protein [Melioribacteraceae bacterium]
MKFLARFLFVCITSTFLFAQEGVATVPSGSRFAKISTNSDDSPRPKIGIALSGGGALGFAHIGALKIIDSLGIPLDYVTGTSMGAIVGGFYSIGYSPTQMESLATTINWIDLFNDSPARAKLPYFEKELTGRYQLNLDLVGFTPKIPTGLIYGQKISLLFSSITYKYEFKKNFDLLPIPFKCVAVDLITGNEVILENGSLSKALRASMSIPTVFSPEPLDQYLLIDGGVLNNFPTDIVKNMGADIVIGLSLSLPRKSYDDYKTFIDILDRTTDIPRYKRLSANKDIANLEIEQDVSGYSLMDFDNTSIAELIRRGEVSARSYIPQLLEIKKQIGNKFYSNDSLKNLRKEKTRDYTVRNVIIRGNKSLDFSFINNLLDIKEGQLFDTKIIEKKITNAYSLGYFDKINYEIIPVDDIYVDLIIDINEKSMERLYLGLKYDDYFKLVGALKLKTTSFFVSGVRTELELQFAGLFKLSWKGFYPSRSLNFPIYPFLQLVYKDIPTDIYDDNAGIIARYKDRSTLFGAGLGISLDNNWALEGAYNFEYMNTSPQISFSAFSDLFPNFMDKLRRFDLSLKFDSIDDPILPTTGVRFSVDSEISNKVYGSDINYSRVTVKGDLFQTIDERHTLRFAGSYRDSWQDIPNYKFFYFTNTDDFIGLEYYKLAGVKFITGRTEYRYKFKKDIFFKLIFNAAFDYRLTSNPVYRKTTNKPIIGLGLGVQFLSIVGPIELIVANGDKNIFKDDKRQTLVYINAGFKF